MGGGEESDAGNIKLMKKQEGKEMRRHEIREKKTKGERPRGCQKSEKKGWIDGWMD